MKKNLITAILMTVVTTVLLGIIYPLVVTAMAQTIFPDKANGQLIQREWQDRWLQHHRPAVRRARITSTRGPRRQETATMPPTPAARISAPPIRS